MYIGTCIAQYFQKLVLKMCIINELTSSCPGKNHKDKTDNMIIITLWLHRWRLIRYVGIHVHTHVHIHVCKYAGSL